ncbi:hypothetical protein AYL99_11979 [Fonsecaea erecta]|uniref:Uncharacterized protein n=1 Tax=Fonsecaea erecta TaxID=1367422 RepID=A0A178Z1Y7_9EURO|nr:hypothetical protein AYL99_11979 [Fonsecaea erecta]OAP53822.1 hypothetical protein AYL99_11979 [Fonsecaea erecta]
MIAVDTELLEASTSNSTLDFGGLPAFPDDDDNFDEADVQVSHGQQGRAFPTFIDKYQYMPEALVQVDYIASTVYSIRLNDLASSMGEIVFGGVNTENEVENRGILI